MIANAAPPAPDPEALRQLEEILSRYEFHSLDDWWHEPLNRLGRALLEALDQIGVPEAVVKWGPTLWVVFEVGAVLLLGLTLFFLLRPFLRDRFGQSPESIRFEGLDSLDAVRRQLLLRERLDQAVGEGNWLEALRLRYRLMVERQSARGLLTPEPGATLGELAEAISSKFPRHRSQVGEVTLRMNLCLYGEKPAARGDFETVDRSLSLLEQG